MSSTHHIILFYKYTPIPNPQAYIEALQVLIDGINSITSSSRLSSASTELNIKSDLISGRILVGSNDNEGINGTLSGTYYPAVLAFCYAMMKSGLDVSGDCKKSEGTKQSCATNADLIKPYQLALDEFIKVIEHYEAWAWEEFKWSKHTIEHCSSNAMEPLFPDLKISLVKEIINTGGRLDRSNVTLDDVHKGYLSPEEWHNMMQNHKFGNSNGDDAILIDCRNHKEYAIGHFEGAIDPNTKTFSEFFDWVDKQKKKDVEGGDLFSKKKVFMYCTGGIRCEKASAFLRKETNAAEVYHLKGGIHRYIEKYGDQGHFHGKNFVFDRRIAQDPSPSSSSGANIVGKCIYCSRPWDLFSPGDACTVCRELVLVCSECKKSKYELHCGNHLHLSKCYFTNLDKFTIDELSAQLDELESLHDDIAVGKSFKQKRRTLQRQIKKVSDWIELKMNGDKVNREGKRIVCRHCMTENCSGDCWGFHGLARAKILDQKRIASESFQGDKNCSKVSKTRSRQSANQRVSKLKQKAEVIDEISKLGLFKPTSHFRNSITGIRCPPPFVRTLKTNVKGKWVGKPVMEILKDQFQGFHLDKVNEDMLERGLIHVNDTALNKCSISTISLRNMDTISRIMHWHEPPVIVPDMIKVSKFNIGGFIEGKTENIECTTSNEDILYVCEKPASVPVHPTGPYLFNTLTMMVEAQLNLEPRSLFPCHRLDRVTSGIVICASSLKSIRFVQSQISSGSVSKIYLARVRGKFPESESQCCRSFKVEQNYFSVWTWQHGHSGDENSGHVVVNAKIDTIDPSNGIRKVCDTGKASETKFMSLSYNEELDLSTVMCAPITGRSHQIRVHLSWLGFPIQNDVQYGGVLSSNDQLVNQNGIKSVIEANSIRSQANENLDDVALSLQKAAIETCACCGAKSEKEAIERVKEAFSSSQVLEEGRYAIDLHAAKYRLNLSHQAPGRSQKKEDNKFIDLYTGQLPSWAPNISIKDLKMF